MNVKKLKKKNGITLIALVITIIVMLILVAVTISMAVNGGLFDYAGKAVGDTNNAMLAEQQLANGGLEVGGVWYNTIDEYLATKGGSGETGEDEEPITGNNGETFTGLYTETKPYTDGNGDTATIPAGFALGTSEGINKVDTGLVIRDANGNEFVWIPVEEDLGSYYQFDSNRYEPKELTSNYSSSSAAYDSQATLDYLYGENYYTYSEDFKYAEEYAKMVEKVNQYNGFYIGRYETTIDSDGNIGTKYNTPVLTAGTVMFTKDETDYPYRWYGLYYTSKNANVTGNGTDVQTAMIYGVLYDQTMQFIRDQKTAGNTTYDVDTATSSWHSGSAVVNSGQLNPGETGDVALNIWDLESNAFEWTQEAYSTVNRVYRGGSYDYSFKASDRYNYYPTSYYTYYSVRLALYLQ